MGGRYTTSLGKRNSHLLIRAAAGPKFAGCASRAVTPVTADWLIESAYAGETWLWSTLFWVIDHKSVPETHGLLTQHCMYVMHHVHAGVGRVNSSRVLAVRGLHSRFCSQLTRVHTPMPAMG